MTDVIKLPTPKAGEVWYVKLPGSAECKVHSLFSVTDNLYILKERVWEYSPPTYGYRWSDEKAFKRCDVEFVEKISR